MVQIEFRQVAPGGTLEQARAEVLRKSVAGYFVDSDGTRRFTIGDGVRTLGQLIDAGETFDVKGGLGIITGDGPPSDSIGRNGEQYYDRVGREMWGPKAGGSWTGTSQGALAAAPSDHGALTGRDDDDHPQYHNDARFDARLATKNLDAVVDSATRLALTNDERTKLTGIQPGATATVVSDDETLADASTTETVSERAIKAYVDANAGGGGGAIADDAVTNAKLANVATATLKGRATAGTGDPEDLTAAAARTLLNVADGANAYVHPNHSGDVTSAADGATTIANDAVTNAKAANMAEATLKGRAAGAGTGDPTDLTPAEARTILNVADGANAYTHPNHTGDVTSSSDGATSIAAGAVVEAKIGTGAVTADKIGSNAVTTAKVQDAAVTLAKLANLAEARMMGRPVGAGAGAPQEMTAAQVLTFLGLDAVSHLDTGPWDDEATYNQFVALIEGDTLYLQSSATPSVNENPTAGAPWVVLLRGITADERTKLTGIAPSANNYAHPNHSGDVTSSGDGATTIANDAVTNAKAANMAEATLKGRAAGAGTGDPTDLTPAEARTILNVADGANATVVSDDETLADASTTETVSERAIKAYVDANAGGGGYPQTLAATHDYIAGRFYPLVGPNTVPALTTQAMAANRADLQLWVPDQDITFDQLGVQITTGAAGNVKVLVYDSDAAGWPDELIYQSGNLDTTSTGFANAATSLPTFLAGVRYWVGHISDAAATARGISATAQRSLGMGASADAAVGYALRRTGLTFASPPDPWTWVSSDVASTANTVIVIGRAT